MNKVQTLAAEMATAVKQAEGIVAEAQKPGNRLSAEQKTTLDRIIGRVSEIKAEIAEVEDIEQKAKDLVGIHDWLSRPEYKIPRGDRVGNGETETKTALSAIGWEVKSGMVMAPTSLGTYAPYCPEEVLFGDLPQDDLARKFYLEQRSIFQPEYRKTFLKFIKLAIKTRDQAMAYQQLEPAEQKALSEGTDTLGGFLVPPDVQAEVLVRLPMKSVMRQLCRVEQTSRDIMTWPLIAANAGSTANGSIYSSGFVGDWASETPVFTDVNPGIGAFPVAVRKIRCATKISNDLVADSVFNFLAFLSRDGSSNMALVEDNGFIAGQTSYFANGAGVTTQAAALQPLGMLSAFASSTNGVNVAGNTAHKISNDLTHIGSTTLIPAVQANLPQQYQPNAKWLMHRLTELEIRQLTDTTGRPIFAPGYLSPTGTAAEQFNTLYGKDLARSDFMPQDGTASTPVIIYGDFSNYIIAQRAGITVTILRERFADTDQTGIILWERVGGALWNTDSVRFGYVS